jgi:Pro-kumamolisin, activation domain
LFLPLSTLLDDIQLRSIAMEHDEEHKPPPIRTSSPAISTFVLYAERSICFGEHNELKGGDIGVHAIAQSSYGVQLKAGARSVIDERYNVYSPSIRLEKHVKVGVVQTNSLDDDGVAIGSPLPFPVRTMPAPPLSSTSNGDTDVTVVAGEVRALLPGDYGTANVVGILLLNPGSYTFKGVTLTDGAKLFAIAGVVQLNISGNLVAGRHVHVSTSFDRPADNLRIGISGYDKVPGQPTASFGNGCFIRALLATPHGTLAMADHTRAIGAFMGFDITLGADVCVDFQCGFPSDGEGNQGNQPLSGYYGPNPNPNIAPLVGPVPPDTSITLSIGLPMRDSAGLQSLADELTDPMNAKFRQYLTPAQFSQSYAPTDADYQSLKDWATSNGFTLSSTFSNNLLLGVTSTAARIQAALYVNLVHRLNSEGAPFVTVDREPSIDLAVPILRITGLTDFYPPQAHGSANGTGSNTDYRAADIRAAYLGSDARVNGLNGSGEVVGIVAFALYNPSDVVNYNRLQTINITSDVSSVLMSPAPTGYNAEVALDIETVQAIAPAANIVVFTSGNGDVIYNAMASYDPPLTCVTTSWTFGGATDNIQQAILSMTVLGVSCFCVSQDFGDVGDPNNNVNVPWQTLVGGTTLSTNPLIQGPTGTPPTYPIPYYAGETTLNLNPPPKGKGITGGGVMNGVVPGCNCFPYPSCCGNPVPIPIYQQAIQSTSSQTNGGSLKYRNYPDVAWLANNVEIYYSGGVGSYWGTSIAAPMWAGFLALANQYKKQVDSTGSKIGFINPTLYGIGVTRGSANDLYALCFNDIADGVSNYNSFPNTTGYTSVPGYDLCTGLGTPKPALLYQLISGTPLSNNQPLNFIHWQIGTGKDDAGGGFHGSSVTATIYMDPTLSLKETFKVTLRKNSDPHWDNWSTHSGEIAIPTLSDMGVSLPAVTPSQPIGGFQLHLEQSNDGLGADNWDVTSLAVSLYNEPYSSSTAICQLNRVGTNKLQDGSTGLVRLSLSRGDSGNGPDSDIYSPGPGSGCP